MSVKPVSMPVVLMLVAVAMIAFGLYQLNRMPPTEYPEMNPAFELQGLQGTMRLEDLQGKVGIIYFGYTHCPDVCPTTLVNIAAALKKLDKKELEKVRALFITTDPERDTAQRMDKFARYFDPHIVGLSGSKTAIRKAAKAFLAGYAREEKADAPGEYTMTHSSYIYILRPDGKMGKLLSHESTPEEIVETVRYWLKWAD